MRPQRLDCRHPVNCAAQDDVRHIVAISAGIGVRGGEVKLLVPSVRYCILSLARHLLDQSAEMRRETMEFRIRNRVPRAPWAASVPVVWRGAGEGNGGVPTRGAMHRPAIMVFAAPALDGVFLR